MGCAFISICSGLGKDVMPTAPVIRLLSRNVRGAVFIWNQMYACVKIRRAVSE